jgi:hypothetical protein
MFVTPIFDTTALPVALAAVAVHELHESVVKVPPWGSFSAVTLRGRSL